MTIKNHPLLGTIPPHDEYFCQIDGYGYKEGRGRAFQFLDQLSNTVRSNVSHQPLSHACIFTRHNFPWSENEGREKFRATCKSTCVTFIYILNNFFYFQLFTLCLLQDWRKSCNFSLNDIFLQSLIVFLCVIVKFTSLKN